MASMHAAERVVALKIEGAESMLYGSWHLVNLTSIYSVPQRMCGGAPFICGTRATTFLRG